MAAVGLVAKVIRPYREAGLQSHLLDQTRRKVAALDSQNAELHRRIILLNTTNGIVTEARMMGYLKPGEIPFVVESATQPTSHDSAAQNPVLVPTSPKLHSHLRGLLHRLTGH